jgi:hypothetical protein
LTPAAARVKAVYTPRQGLLRAIWNGAV